MWGLRWKIKKKIKNSHNINKIKIILLSLNSTYDLRTWFLDYIMCRGERGE